MDLEYQKDLKTLRSPPIPLPAALPPNPPPLVPDNPHSPSSYVTVLMVYSMYKAQFHSLKKRQEKSLLCTAGKRAVDAYRSKYGTWPAQITEGSYEAVNKYPMEAKELVLDALRASYREILGGGGQRSLSFN